MVEQARLEQLDTGLAPVTDGWFVVSIPEAAWLTSEAFGAACILESDDVSFPQIGYTVHVLQPGMPNGMYHREAAQEDFLVLSGECVLLVEGEERRLKAWDFVHCPPDTEHIFVGAGDGPCVIFMVGGRSEDWQVGNPVSDLAARYGASAAKETPDPDEAYVGFEPSRIGRP